MPSAIRSDVVEDEVNNAEIDRPCVVVRFYLLVRYSNKRGHDGENYCASCY